MDEIIEAIKKYEAAAKVLKRLMLEEDVRSLCSSDDNCLMFLGVIDDDMTDTERDAFEIIRRAIDILEIDQAR